MTDWTTARVTPEIQAELRRLLDAPPQDITIARDDALALLDAAAERDWLAGLLDEPRRSGCAVEIAGVRIAPCDERGQTADMRALDAAVDRLDHMREAPDVAELRRLAEAATPGPWEADGLEGTLDSLSTGRRVAEVTMWPEVDAVFIAAASPDVVLSLLDRLTHMTEVRDNARAEVERLTAQIEAAIDAAHLDRQQAWSAETFGPAEVRGHRGVLDHIRKELSRLRPTPATSPSGPT